MCSRPWPTFYTIKRCYGFFYKKPTHYSLVRNKIYTVNFVHASDDSTISTAADDSTAVIQFTEADDGSPLDGESVFVEFGTMDNNEVREEIKFGLDDFITSLDPDHYYRKRQTSLPPEFIMPILYNKGRS